MADARKYTDEDVRAVIDKALQRQSGDALNHADLVAIGAGVGLSAEEIEKAASEVAEARLDAQAAGRVTSGRRRWLAVHAAAFSVLNAFFFAVNYLTTPGEWWVLFPLLSWGLLLLLHAGLALGSKVSARSLARARRELAEASRENARSPQRRALRVEDEARQHDLPGAARDAGTNVERDAGTNAERDADANANANADAEREAETHTAKAR